MNILSKAKHMYMNNVSNITLFTTSLALTISCCSELLSSDRINPNIRFKNIIGMTSVGFITGVTYPVSFPLMGICLLSSNAKHDK